jgi:hypothetical protein
MEVIFCEDDDRPPPAVEASPPKPLSEMSEEERIQYAIQLSLAQK